MSMARELEPQQSKPAVCQPKENAAASAEKSAVSPTCPKWPRHRVLPCGRFNLDANNMCLTVRLLKQQKV